MAVPCRYWHPCRPVPRLLHPLARVRKFESIIIYSKPRGRSPWRSRDRFAPVPTKAKIAALRLCRSSQFRILNQSFVQIFPIGIHRNNQIDFLLTIARFYLPFATESGFDVVVNFIISQFIDIVFLGKAVNTLLFVFPYAPNQIVCRPCIKDAVLFVEENVTIG